MTTVTRTVSFTKASHRKQANGCSSAPLDEPVGRVPRVSKLMALAIRFDQRDVRPIVAERDWGMQRLLWYEIRRS